MLFVQDQYRYLVAPALHQEHYVVSQFENQEYLLSLATSVYGKKCTVLGSLTASAEQALQLLILLHTLNKAGVQRVTLCSPYLGYQRQDELSVTTSHGLQWADTMLHAAGVDEVVTLDPHNIAAFASLKTSIIAYSAEHVFEQEIAYFVALGFSLIFPDAGAAARFHWASDKFPTALQGFFEKKRSKGMIQLESFQGKVARKVMICDDILDSGKTLLQVCIALRHMGVEEIVIFVTHAFFYGYVWQDLWNLGVKVLYCTNSLPAAHTMSFERIQVKSVAFLLQKNI